MWCCYHPTPTRVITGSGATLAGTHESRSSESACVYGACEIVKNLSKMYNAHIVYRYRIREYGAHIFIRFEYNYNDGKNRNLDKETDRRRRPYLTWRCKTHTRGSLSRRRR